MIQITWQGYYLDGKTADRQDVEIQLLNDGLKIINAKTGAVYYWPYGEIKQTQGFYGNEPVQLERGGEISEILVIREHEFLTSLHRFAPRAAKRFHNPALRGLRWRLTLYAALFIVAAGVFFYIWGIPLLAKALTPHIPIAWEKGMGESILNILAPEEKRCKDKELQKALDEIVGRLNAAEPGPYAFKVFVVKSHTFNAVALPGGDIIVFTGLLENTASPEALAAVLAHEIQHIKKRHVTKKIVEDSSTGLMISAVTGDVTGSMMYGVKIARTLAILSYSRQDEEGADDGGMDMLIKANLDPEAMIGFFEGMKERTHVVDIPQYISTHPDLDERIARLKKIAARKKTVGKSYATLSSEKNWEQIRTKCATVKTDDE